jgi:hypothetical protein
MHKMDNPTATGDVNIGLSHKLTQAMPITAAIRLPPMTAQGCAIGLDGSTKISSALAPKDAIVQSLRLANPPR